VGYLEGRSLARFDCAVIEIEPASLDGGFRALHVVKRVAPNLQTGLTGRRDLAPDLRMPSGLTTGKVLAGDDSSPFQFLKSSVQEIAICDRRPLLLGGEVRLNGFAGEPFRDGPQQFRVLVV
jgi:hypothetical protein